MSLTDQDLEKIKAAVDARADLQDQKFERRFAESEEKLTQQIDSKINNAKEETFQKIDSVKTILEGDHQGLVEDVETLKSQVTQLQSHHA